MDFDIENGRQQQGLFNSSSRAGNEITIQTNNEQNFAGQNVLRDWAPLLITSRDYGGTARLRAELRFSLEQDPDAGTDPVIADYWFDSVWIDGESFLLPASEERIPVDFNANGIADSWEESHLGSGNLFTNISEDQEPGYETDSPKGDGLSVHDEYRGLHNIMRDGGQVTTRHLRFDPRKKQDVFYIDRDGTFVGSVSSILAAQKKTGAPQAIHSYWELTRLQGRMNNDLITAGRIAVNSFTGSAKSGAFPVLLTPDIPPTSLTGPGTRTLGWAQTENMDGKAIYIDRQAIISVSGPRQINPDVFIAKVVAHEIGHKLSLAHPIRPGCCVFRSDITAISQVGSLGMHEYALLSQPSDQLYIRLRSYKDPLDGGTTEHVDEKLEILSNGLVSTNGRQRIAEFPDGTHVFRVTLSKAISSTVLVPTGSRPTWVRVVEIQKKLMDWTAIRILRQPGDWKFTEGPANGNRSNIEQLKAKE